MEKRACYVWKVSSRCLRSVAIFRGVLASVELPKNGGRFTTFCKAAVPSDHKSPDHKSASVVLVPGSVCIVGVTFSPEATLGASCTDGAGTLAKLPSAKPRESGSPVCFMSTKRVFD
jgi:hypothetical protein